MQLAQLVATSSAVAAACSRKAEVGHPAECLSQLSANEAPMAMAHLAGELPEGRVGVGYRAVNDAGKLAEQATAERGDEVGRLSILDVYHTPDPLAAEEVSNSLEQRTTLLQALLGSATDE